MKNIALIGAGKLGFRHLQALSKISDRAVRILVIDRSRLAIQRAKAQISESTNPAEHEIAYYHDISELESFGLELVIIATTAEHRLDALYEITKNRRIKYIIFEKFLFQRLRDFDEAKKIIDRKKIRSWVNLPRREWPFYNDLKKWLERRQLRYIEVTGSNWSLATSAIHFIDLCAYLASDVLYDLEPIEIDGGLVHAYSSVTGDREEGLKEFFGTLRGKFNGSGVKFSLQCDKGDSRFRIKIHTEDRTLEILEEEGRVIGDQTFEPKVIAVPYQSDLTNIVAERILLTGECNLPSYDEAASLHSQLLEHYCDAFGVYDADFLDRCPIT